MVKPVYKRELSHSYLVIEGIPKEKTDSYQYRMILNNKISGLLEATERYVDGKVCLYYDISSRQSLEQMYESGKMTCQEILDVVDSMSGLLGGMAGYLLEERFLLLEPECIYMDLETENPEKQNKIKLFISWANTVWARPVPNIKLYCVCKTNKFLIFILFSSLFRYFNIRLFKYFLTR